jgi:hypothetical protein
VDPTVSRGAASERDAARGQADDPPLHAGPGSKAREREWHSDSSDLKFKGVCGKCNNGWLSDLEAEASELVGPMVIGEPVVLYGEGRVTVATWAYKMVLLMQMLRAGVPSQRSVDYRRHDGVP